MTAGLLLIGASGLAREVLASGAAGVVGILDDDDSLRGRSVGGVPVVGAIAEAATREERLLVTIGPSRSRADVVGRLRGLCVDEDRFETYVAPSARIGTTSRLGRGCVVLDGVVVTADARIGDHVVIMPNCTITHDDELEDFVTLAAGVSLAGGVTLRRGAYIGTNASVRQGAEVGRASTVGMGSVVLTDVPQDEIWAGVPARRLGEHA